MLISICECYGVIVLSVFQVSVFEQHKNSWFIGFNHVVMLNHQKTYLEWYFRRKAKRKEALQKKFYYMGMYMGMHYELLQGLQGDQNTLACSSHKALLVGPVFLSSEINWIQISTPQSTFLPLSSVSSAYLL